MGNSVSPIRDKRKIAAIKKILSPRDRLMFIIGINSALRVSDLFDHFSNLEKEPGLSSATTLMTFCRKPERESDSVTSEPIP